MEREVQINMAAHKYSKKDMSKNFVEAKVDFMEGARWADENPNWHKFPEDKPRKTGLYLVVLNSGTYKVDVWNKRHEWSEFNSDGILYVTMWMELPKK